MTTLLLETNVRQLVTRIWPNAVEPCQTKVRQEPTANAEPEQLHRHGELADRNLPREFAGIE